ncbi:MAG: hypothetical protein GY715_02280 [Planctomycetes bacterium]|nr:hypothetical protein [Planctomycetota bacterium]
MRRTTFIAVGAALMLAGGGAFHADAASVRGIPPGPTTLPDGHPPLDGGTFPGPETTAERGAAATGSISVQVVQGTPGGPAIGNCEVAVELLHRGMILDTLFAQLDETGTAFFTDIPLDVSFEPVAYVEHAGVTYQQAGTAADAAHPQQRIDVTCFEVAEDDAAPPWWVRMRHVMISLEPEGLKLTEMIQVENPADRTWLGTREGDGKKPVTLRFVLPQGSDHLMLGAGFENGSCTLDDRVLSNHLPLVPRVSELGFTYVIDPDGGTANIEITAPAAVDRMMVIVPEALHVETAEGLSPGGSRQMGQTSVRFYLASDLGTGDVARMRLTGLDAVAAAAAAEANGATPKRGAPNMSKIVAAIGGGLIMLVAIAMILLRSSRAAGQP